MSEVASGRSAGFGRPGVRFDGPFEPLADDVRNASLDGIVDAMPPGDPWLFAYGSLMWDRAVFPFREREPALLRGYRRAFCIWTASARGSPEMPGLSLGLEPGGSCRGIAFRIARHEARAALEPVWRREMHTGCYEPRWTVARLRHRTVDALTFVARRGHVQYAAGLAPEAVVHHVARARGSRGSCRDYLADTLSNLEASGARDRRLERLLARVDARLTVEDYGRVSRGFREGTLDHDVSQNYAALLGAIEARPPYSILDLGCGPGRDLAWFRSRGHEAVGLDGAPEFVEMARAHSGCEVLCRDFLAMDLPPGRFDGIFANASLFHVPSRELPRVLGELHAALKAGGVLFCSNPRGNGEEGLYGSRYNCFHDLETWRGYLTAANFAELDHYYRPPGRPRREQPWLATVWRKARDAAGRDGG